MINAAIINGDTVVVREQPTALDGEIVVVTVDGETTVKRLQLGTREVRLMPENPAFAPIVTREGGFRIRGIVVGVMRQLATSRSGCRSPQTNATRSRHSHAAMTAEGSTAK